MIWLKYENPSTGSGQGIREIGKIGEIREVGGLGGVGSVAFDEWVLGD